jgi:hypothetical protein
MREDEAQKQAREVHWKIPYLDLVHGGFFEPCLLNLFEVVNSTVSELSRLSRARGCNILIRNADRLDLPCVLRFEESLVRL